MDTKIWETTILTWVNSLGLSCIIESIKQIDEKTIQEIIKIIHKDSDINFVKFLNQIFSNYTLCSTSLNILTQRDYLHICTLILIYVCFTNEPELELIKQKMCSTLENSVQEHITEFLINIQEQGDVFSLTSKAINDEILKFSQRHVLFTSAIGDGTATPVKVFQEQIQHESPLMEFLQTPKRKSEGRHRYSINLQNNNEQLKKIKELTDQLIEEELEKASLQEKLKWHETKCHDLEVKMKNKIEELEHMKSEWELEAISSENQIKKLNSVIEKNMEHNEKLLKDISHMENYSSSMEKELTAITAEKKRLENQFQSVLKKCEDFEKEVFRLNKINSELDTVIKNNEEELHILKENFALNCRREGSEETFFLNETLEKSLTVPENMGVVIEELLKEKTFENDTLKGIISDLKSDNEQLKNEISNLKSNVATKIVENNKLDNLNKELMSKVNEFITTCKELEKVRKESVSICENLYKGSEDRSDLGTTNDCTSASKTVIESKSTKSCEPIADENMQDSKKLQILYDCSKEMYESASRISFDENGASLLTTITECTDGSEEVLISTESTNTLAEKINYLNELQVEELNQEILSAKNSLMSFLKVSMRNFEVLKIKESLIDEMSKQHEQLENRITSLTDLNDKLTKEVMNSKNICIIDSELKEKELENLKLEVDSLRKGANLLKEKLAQLKKANEVLLKKKEECLSELEIMREKNKSLNNDLQNRIISQLKQQNSCLAFIRSKHETILELEKTLKAKDKIDRTIAEIRNSVSSRENKVSLEISLNVIEQKYYISAQNLLQTAYSCLKWSAKNVEHQCFLLNESDKFPSTDLCPSSLKKEGEEIREKLKVLADELSSIMQDLDLFDIKNNETTELSDSLEITTPNNKTFDIITSEETNINERTFSINRNHVEINGKNIRDSKSAWIISPPSKVNAKEKGEIKKKDKPVHRGEGWIIPLSPVETKNAKSQSVISLKNQKSEIPRQKSSFSCAATDIEYSPTLKPDSKESSVIKFLSASDMNLTHKFITEVDKKEFCSNEKLSDKSYSLKQESVKVPDTETDSSMRVILNLENQVQKLQEELATAVKENKLLRTQLDELEKKREKDQENFEKNQESLRLSITSKYESQLEHLKSEMKSLYNSELAKHKTEQSKLNFELQEQNKIYKDHVDDLRNQLWDLGEKLLHEQKLKRDLERNLAEMKKNLNLFSFRTDVESRSSQDSELPNKKEKSNEENFQSSVLKQFKSASFLTIPTEDEDEVFDNRCLEDMKVGICRVEGSERRLTELQLRNSLCLPHLKSSYPGETQFHNPKMFKENEIKYGCLNFGQESHSLSDSDQSMTRSLIPGEKGKRKDQTSYKKPGPPTPSKNGGRLSSQLNDFHLTPRKVLRESNEMSERKCTPGRIKSLFIPRTAKRESLHCKDENTAPGTSRGKKLKIFPSVKPFGGRDY